jgi:hypothetical protein
MSKIFSYTFPNLILKTKFVDHKKYKKEILNLIKKSNDKAWVNKKDSFNDKLLKTDWPNSDNWERPWIKLIVNELYKELVNFSQYMGYQSIQLHKMWYQQYSYGDVHNWHTHDGNYTGTYYLEFDKNCSTTEFLYPNDLNKSFTVEVEEGDILFFPCSLIHRSSVSRSKKTKSIISWNTDFDKIQNEFIHDRKEIEILKENK